MHTFATEKLLACIYQAPEQMERARASETEPSLLDLVEHWLERTPGVNTDWWSELERNVKTHQVRASCVVVFCHFVVSKELYLYLLLKRLPFYLGERLCL